MSHYTLRSHLNLTDHSTAIIREDFESLPNQKEEVVMDTYEQLRALTAVIANLSFDGVWSERTVMETLLEVFEPQELVELGYGDRVDAYMEQYGEGREIE